MDRKERAHVQNRERREEIKIEYVQCLVPSNVIMYISLLAGRKNKFNFSSFDATEVAWRLIVAVFVGKSMCSFDSAY